MKLHKIGLLIILLLLLTACQNLSTETNETDATNFSVSIIENVDTPDESGSQIESLPEVEEQTEAFESDLNYAEFENLSDLVWYEIETYGYYSDNLSISIYDFVTGEEFHLNADVPSHGASTNKVGTGVLYTDLINQGYLTWESHLPLDPAWVEEGGGEITANPDQASYPVYELVYQSLFYSDNTAWNTLINNYYSMFGDFQADLIALSGLTFENPEIYNLNFATSRMLNEILIRVASNSEYQYIVDIMLEAQQGIFLKMYVDEGMAAKYGQYENGYHDTGIYFKDGEPAYTIAVMSRDLGSIDYFLGDLNLHVKEFHEYQVANSDS